MQKDRTAYEAALHLLKYKSQSTYELKKKLKDRKFAEEDIKKAISKLADYGYVNDQALAEELFENYKTRAVYGDSYIQRKIQSKGLHIDKHLTFEEETYAAIKVLKNKMKIMDTFPKSYKSAAAMLYRRGFSASVISFALNELNISDF